MSEPCSFRGSDPGSTHVAHVGRIRHRVLGPIQVGPRKAWKPVEVSQTWWEVISYENSTAIADCPYGLEVVNRAQPVTAVILFRPHMWGRRVFSDS